MSKKKTHPRKKRRTREHVIADLSVNFVERQALLCGYSVERLVHDYGLDLVVYTYNDEGEVEPGEIYLQLKATDQPKILADGQHLSLRIETADLQYWLEEPSPVILIMYDAGNDEAYWLYVQAFFQKKKGLAQDLKKKQITVHVSLTNKVDQEAMKLFAQFNRQVLAQRKGIKHHE